MTKTTKYGNRTVYTLNCSVSANLLHGKINGDIVLEDFSSIPLNSDSIIEFSPDVFRLIPHSQELIKEEPWLIQLQPILPNNKLFMFSVGGEYIDDIELKDLKNLLKKIIFIN
jgi:hypothetical protein